MTDRMTDERIAEIEQEIASVSDMGNVTTEEELLQALVERLRAGGCERDQKTTQYCAEAAELAKEVERLRAAAPQDELARLEREIAEEAAISMIECAGLPVREGTEKCDPLWFDISDGECHPDDRYLELRGLLERHPDYPNWVRFVNS